MTNKGICVVAELTSENKLAPITLELIEAAKRLAKDLDNEDVSVLLICGDIETSSIISQLEQAGAQKCYLIKGEKFAEYSTAYFAKAVETVVNEYQPSIMLFGATTRGRDLAPRLSARLKTGLIADCIALEINEKGQLAATRPTFGGSLMATILCKTYPQMVTVRQKVFSIPEIDLDNQIQVEEVYVNIENIQNKVEILKTIKIITETSGIEDAEIIVAGGMGMKSAENFKLLEELANLLGGKVAATRKVTDIGWRKHSEQVGQTGKTVKPKLYIACGISGATQHIVGMAGSKTIIAINTDKNASIFNVADYGIVGDAVTVVKMLIKELKNTAVQR